MTWILLAPAFAVVAALTMMAWSMHRVDAEVRSLRDSLRLSRAAGVATDELDRHTRGVARRALEIDTTARARAELRRSRRRSARR